jgi:hypothetical protein
LLSDFARLVLPFYHPENKPKVRRAKPGIVLWTLRKGRQTLRCELRDDSPKNIAQRFAPTDRIKGP